MSGTITAGRRQSERRRDRRIDAPMTIVIGNTPYGIGDWSPSGARIVDYVGSLGPGDVAQLIDREIDLTPDARACEEHEDVVV